MYSSGNLYHNSFTPLPLGGSALDASSNTTTPVSVVAPAQHATQHLPRDSTTHIVNENLRSQVRVLEDEVRVLRRAVAEPLGGVRADQAAAAAAVSSSSSPPAQSSDFYYTSAAAIAARRRAQIEELRRRTQILSEAKGNATTPAHREVQNGLGGSGTSRQARIPSARKLRPSSAGASSSSARRTHSTTATTSTPGSSRPRGRFVSPVEIVMVPTSSRTTSRYKKRAQTEAREEDTDEEDESETVRGNRAQTSRRGKPEMAFGHRVVPSTARPTHALTARTTANAAAPWKQPDGDIPIQGIGRGASLMPSPTASRHHHDVHMSPHDHTARSDVERTRRDMNDEDDESERQAILRAVLGDLYQSTAVATVHGGGSQSAACAATSAIRPNEPAQGHPYLALLPTASTAQSGGYVNASIPVVPPILSPPEGPSTTAGDSTTAALEADVALLTRTVDVLRRTLIDRDAFLQRLAESMHLSAKRPSSSSSTSSAAAAVAHTRTSPSSIDDAPDVTVRALAEELQRVRDVLLHTQQQLVLTEQQFTQNQVALTRRNEELVALRAHLQSNPNNAPAHNTDSSAQQSQPTGGSGGTASMGGLVGPLSASVRTLDSNLGRCSSQNIATTTTAAAAGASEVNPLGMSPRGELAADANPSRPSSDNTAYYTTTAWSSTVGTPSLVPLPLTSLPPPIPVPQPSLPSGAAAAITHEHLAQTLPPPSAPPLSAFPPSVPAPPTETTTMTTVAELQNKLAVMTRKVQAWESWYAKQQQEKRERVDVDEPAALAHTASRSVCDARSEPLYYSAYTIDSLSARASPAAVRSHATQGLPDAMRCCDRCAMLSRAEGEAAPPPHNVCASRRDPKECAESPAALLSQTNWDLRQDVREAVARERVLREIAMKERQVAEERLAQATQWREAHEKEGGSGAIANGSSSHNSDDRMIDAQKSTPPPPPQPQETVD